jgi:isochorismate synthase
MRKSIANALFSSDGRGLYCYGLQERITVPVGEARHDGLGLLHRSVESALERAREAGQDNPIVIGAIPFDAREASCLYVPTSYEWREAGAKDRAEACGAPSLVDQRSIPDEVGFKKAVAHALINFPHSDVSKAVLSVIRELRFAERMDVDELLARLRVQNRAGYLFRVPLPEAGDLVGISPELLIRKEGGRVMTRPLAGSAKRAADEVLDGAVAELLEASDKDQYEHRLVVENIRDVLGPLCASLDVPERPALMKTPTLWHLCTPIEGVLKDPGLTALQLACILHPTPAVCGLPTAEAHKLIRYVEPFERGFFTGFVGWCDSHGNGEWAVTIRCGTVQNDTLRLFAGAGIVEASNPDSEWAEVQAKLGTMLNACGVAA